jgi:hypothetical protein
MQSFPVLNQLVYTYIFSTVLSRTETDYNCFLQHLSRFITLKQGADRVVGTSKASAFCLDFWTKNKIEK